PGVVTVGVVTLISVSEDGTPVTARSPNSTSVVPAFAARKPLPLSVTCVPPSTGPFPGASDASCGPLPVVAEVVEGAGVGEMGPGSVVPELVVGLVVGGVVVLAAGGLALPPPLPQPATTPATPRKMASGE